jgi:CO/xanthine dehydrogenase Mo-binding subunit
VQLEAIARALGIDPLELRLRNAPISGDPQPTGGVFHHSRAREVLETAAGAIDWSAPRRPHVGKGLSLAEHSPRVWPFGAELEARSDGRVVMRTSIPEVGVGSHTTYRQLVAQELTIPVTRVLVLPSIDGLPPDRGVGASIGTRLVGNANRVAARRLRERLAALVAAEFGVEPAEVTLADGHFAVPGGARLALGEVVSLAGSSVVEQYTHEPNDAGAVEAWTAQAAEVELDPETGQLRVLRVVSVHDVGEVVNPLLHQGQIDGSVVQGFGAATMERLALDDGRIVNPNLSDYRLPGIGDVPPLVTIHLPPDLESGIKPIGEAANSGVVAAIANAVADVTGCCPTTYPLSAEDLRATLRSRAASGAQLEAAAR